MLHGVEWLGKKYSALSKAGPNPTLIQTITTFANRLHEQPSSPDNADAAAQEKRGAILSLKGLAKDHPKEVASHAGSQLLDFLVAETSGDRAASDDVIRSLIETLLTLCTPVEQPQPTSRISFGGRKIPAQPAIPLALDQFLETPQPLHALLPLLAPSRSFYLRFSSLQLLALLLRHRKTAVQSHVLTSPGGCGAILECLSTTSPSGHSLGSSAEIIRNEALLLLPHLVDSNADIQKLIAFEGAFEKLLDVVAQEGRIEGGVVVQDALEALEALLRYNVSNQNYFRETLSIPMLAPLLFYPPPLPPNAPVHLATQRDEQLEGFAFQPWEYDASDELAEEEAQRDNEQQQQQQQQQSQQHTGPRFVGDTQKLINARLVVGIAGLLVQGVGEGKRANQNALLSTGFFHALLDLALGSSAPVPLKTQALQVLASLLQHSRSVQDALGEASVTPVEPIKVQLAADLASQQQPPLEDDKKPSSDAPRPAAPPPTSSQAVEYARLPPQAALLVLIQAALAGIPAPHRPIDGRHPAITGFRAAAVKALQSILSDNIDARLFVVASMASAEQSKPDEQPGAVLLEALTVLPTNGQSEGFDEFKALFAGMILNSAIKGSDTVKNLALRLRYGADGNIRVLPEDKEADKRHGDDNDDDDDDDASVLSVLIGNITVALRSQGDAVKTERSQAAGAVIKGPTSTSWTRVLIAHLTLLALWLHKSPKSVAHVVADSSNVQAIVQLVAEGANGEPLLVGLGTWVLGILYEWGPAPTQAEGTTTRREIHDLATSRIGLDQYEAKLERLRDDPRLRLVGPDILDRVGHRPDPVTTAASHAGAKDGVAAQFAGNAKTSAEQLSPSDDNDPSLTDVWFDWTWAEFWRNESVTIANALLVPPGTTSAEAASAPAELLDAQRQIEQLRDEVKRLQREVEAREHSLNDAGEKHTANEAALSELRTELSAVKTQLETSQADSGRSTEAAQSQLHASQERVLQVERSFEEEKTRSTELQERLVGAEEQVSILKEQLSVSAGASSGGDATQVAELQKSNDALKAELETVQARVRELESGESASKSLQEELAATKKELEDAVEAEKKRSAEVLAAERKDWEGKLAEQKRSSDEALAAAESKGAASSKAGAASADEVSKAKASAKKAESDLKAAEKKHGDALKAAEKKHGDTLKAAEKKHTDALKAAEKKHADALKAAEKKHTDTAKERDEAQRDAKKSAEEVAELKKQSASGGSGDGGSSERVTELEQENQDLLVMLDELSTKRKRDKAKLKEKGEEVSEDEEEDDDVD